MNAEDYRSVPSNGFPCDFCEGEPVGWVRVRLPNRSTGGVRGVEVFMVCVDHIGLGEPVYPSDAAARR